MYYFTKLNGNWNQDCIFFTTYFIYLSIILYYLDFDNWYILRHSRWQQRALTLGAERHRRSRRWRTSITSWWKELVNINIKAELGLAFSPPGILRYFLFIYCAAFRRESKEKPATPVGRGVFVSSQNFAMSSSVGCAPAGQSSAYGSGMSMFRWLEVLEKEFDKAFVDVDMLLGEIDPDQVDITYEGRQKMTSLSSCFAQLCHKMQTVFQLNHKLEVNNSSNNFFIYVDRNLTVYCNVKHWRYWTFNRQLLFQTLLSSLAKWCVWQIKAQTIHW